MDNIRHSIKILFKNRNPNNVLDEYFNIQLNSNKSMTENIDGNYFSSIFSAKKPLYYSKDEINNVKDLLEDEWLNIEHSKMRTIFNILPYITDKKKILLEINDEPYCNYEMLLKWRDISYALGEDIFTTSFIAYKDIFSNRNRVDFSWKPVISTNNYRLKEILSRGMAENHFHLKGSSPHFEISWISLMNNIENRRTEFEELEKESSLLPDINISFNETKDSLELLVKKASYIRMKLFYVAYGIPINSNGCIVRGFNLCQHEKEILLANTTNEFDFYLNDIQNKIDILKYEDFNNMLEDVEIFDYAIRNYTNLSSYKKHYNLNSKDKYNQYYGNAVFNGERKLLYTIFKGLFKGDKSILKYKDLFYAYLLIKVKFRNELIQVNDRVGFFNFADYQNRKSYFIKDDCIYEKAIYNLSINSSLKDQNIESLEARIAPKNYSEDLDKSIKKIDRIINDKSFFSRQVFYDTPRYYGKRIFDINENYVDEKYFYNIHFIKSREENNKDDRFYKEKAFITPRNNKVRNTVELQAKALINLRKSVSTSAKRILGIDAANFEIGCRPEVFGQAFRYIKNYKGNGELEFLGVNNFTKIGVSFHAGEDFLDLADGLRAIDEAIRFLNLNQGDRLGHALALGIDAKEYYESKCFNIILPKQELLDNVVWVMAKMRKYNIVETCVIDHLNKCYLNLFHDIYGHIKFNNGYNNYEYEIYYDSWKLRGDNPKLYLTNKFTNKYNMTFWDKCGINDYCRSIDRIRNNEVITKLYRDYHFDPKVKVEGDKKIEFKISSGYVKVIKKIQKAMQIEIGRKNIGIETNPTSNYLISTFKRYSKHPIIKFNNIGLTYDSDKLKENPQLFVSINTDDQGVFATYLENEYALLGLALEKERDENGNYKYNQSMIYDWLDRIRRMGIEQSFKNI